MHHDILRLGLEECSACNHLEAAVRRTHQRQNICHQSNPPQ